MFYNEIVWKFESKYQDFFYVYNQSNGLVYVGGTSLEDGVKYVVWSGKAEDFYI